MSKIYTLKLLLTEHDHLVDGPMDPDGRPLKYFSCHEPTFHVLENNNASTMVKVIENFYARFQ